MPVSLAALRAAGTQTIALRTAHGRFVGRVAQADIPEFAVVILFAVDEQGEEPLVVPVDTIEEIEQR